MTDPVSVPLSRLRVMPKAGSPALVTPGTRAIIVGYASSGDAEYYCVDTGDVFQMSCKHVALDLTAPTTSRIDGATVAATMLAEAAGLDVSRGVTWRAWRNSARVNASVEIRAGKRSRTFKGYCFSDDPRDILAAVLLAVLGVDRG